MTWWESQLVALLDAQAITAAASLLQLHSTNACAGFEHKTPLAVAKSFAWLLVLSIIYAQRQSTGFGAEHVAYKLSVLQRPLLAGDMGRAGHRGESSAVRTFGLCSAQPLWQRLGWLWGGHHQPGIRAVLVAIHPNLAI